uniref:Uncharacterized protein n=3 Tax=Oryza TaxID=4527 RepID=Q851Q8_ORYSJ|nr:hypothetical protein [Oryza sativa Japonica Group]ABF99378.1 hypothetical protein LOC_Os03g58560 [Oryza sativa Japonica Group]
MRTAAARIPVLSSPALVNDMARQPFLSPVHADDVVAGDCGADEKQKTHIAQNFEGMTMIMHDEVAQQCVTLMISYMLFENDWPPDLTFKIQITQFSSFHF